MDRETIVRRFEAWLDEALAAEQPPEGLAAELLAALESDGLAVPDGRCDLYSMWAAVTALTQEVKLSGRSFKQLSETLAPMAELGARVDAVLQAHTAALAELRRDAETRARAEVLDALLDLRDRLVRGLESARRCAAGQASWFGRFVPRRRNAVQEALEKGYRLTLERLEESLDRFQVSEIPCLDRPFDPARMSVVDTEETERVPEGTVLEVYRPGYEWRGEVYRPAHVKVARSARGQGVENE